MKQQPPFAENHHQLCAVAKPGTDRKVYCELAYWHEAEGFKSHRTRDGKRWIVKPHWVKVDYRTGAEMPE